jgi:choline dehydrogenase-like flavoprotein
MGSPDDPRSVVDPDCRVLALEGLRVADSSIMPDIVRANTHLSSIVIGENAARKILAGIRRRSYASTAGEAEDHDEVTQGSTPATVAARL